MIGDAAWRDLLWERYQQHRRDAARKEREPQVFERWAVEATWRDYVSLARNCREIPAFCWQAWETHTSVPCVGGHGFGSLVLARPIINDWLMVRQIGRHLRRHSRRAHAAAVRYVKSGSVPDDMRASLTRAKRLVYDWLTLCSADDATVLTRPLT